MDHSVLFVHHYSVLFVHYCYVLFMDHFVLLLIYTFREVTSVACDVLCQHASTGELECFIPTLVVLWRHMQDTPRALEALEAAMWYRRLVI